MAQRRQVWRMGSAVALTALALGACGRGGPFPSSTAAAGQAPPDAGYRAPPELSGLARGGDGTLSLLGRAPASSQVRLASPAGALAETVADGAGAWRAALGPVSEPALYGLSAEADGRRVQAEGYVAVLPGPPGVALLRAGAGAQVVGSVQPAAGPRIQAVDFDRDGAAVVSGRATPGGPLRVMVDGGAAMDGSAGADGRFSLTLPKPLAEGARRIQVMGPKGVTETVVRITPPLPLTEGPYRAAPEGTGWRIDWITPGGGAQSTLLLGDAAG